VPFSFSVLPKSIVTWPPLTAAPLMALSPMTWMLPLSGHYAAGNDAVQRQRRIGIDRNPTGVRDIDQNIERAAGYLDRSRAGIRNGALILEIAALAKRDEAGISAAKLSARSVSIPLMVKVIFCR